MYRKRQDPINRILSGKAMNPPDFHHSPEPDIGAYLVVTWLGKNLASSLQSNTKRTIIISVYPNLDARQSAYNIVFINVAHHNSAWLQAHLDFFFALFKVFETGTN
jgi:hypothetical protein